MINSEEKYLRCSVCGGASSTGNYKRLQKVAVCEACCSALPSATGDLEGNEAVDLWLDKHFPRCPRCGFRLGTLIESGTPLTDDEWQHMKAIDSESKAERDERLSGYPAAKRVYPFIASRDIKGLGYYAQFWKAAYENCPECHSAHPSTARPGPSTGGNASRDVRSRKNEPSKPRRPWWKFW